MEVVEGIHRVDTMLGTRISSMYLIRGKRSCLLFDTGTDGDASRTIGPYLDEQGIDRQAVHWVVVSHCDVDHFGGLADCRETFSAARVLAHALDRNAIRDFNVYLATRARGLLRPFGFDEQPDVLAWARGVTREGPVDGAVAGSEVLDLGDREVEILHVPGHTKGHLAVCDLATGALVVADAVLGSAVLNADGTGAFPPTYRYVADYLTSIDRLQSVKAPWLLTAHYPAYDGGMVNSFLEESREFAADLHERVKRAIRQADGVTLARLVDAVNDGFGNWPVQDTRNALAFPVAGHVEELARSGGITVDAPGQGNGAPVIRWAA